MLRKFTEKLLSRTVLDVTVGFLEFIEIFIVDWLAIFCISFVFQIMALICTLNRGLDEEIRTVVRGQTNIGHEGRQVSQFFL